MFIFHGVVLVAYKEISPSRIDYVVIGDDCVDSLAMPLFEVYSGFIDNNNIAQTIFTDCDKYWFRARLTHHLDDDNWWIVLEKLTPDLELKCEIVRFIKQNMSLMGV